MAPTIELVPESLHVLLKWSDELHGDTVALHREVADTMGAVWWAGFRRTAGSTGITGARVSELREQIGAGVPTFAYVRGGDELWRARLTDVTADRDEVDEALVPGYYADLDPGVHATSWFRLSEFTPSDERELKDHYWGSRPGKTLDDGAIGNRTTPMYLLAKPGARIEADAAQRVPSRPPAARPARASARSTRRSSGPGSRRNATSSLPPLGARQPLSVDRLARAVADRLMVDRALLEQLVAHLESGKHVILTGPPGTGKTTLARLLAVEAQRANWSRDPVVTTATSDWTTYETIGGLRETVEGLSFHDGHFLEAIAAQRWLVVDELNRAQFDRAFGPLFTVLSGHPVVLPHHRPGRSAQHPIALVPEGYVGGRDGWDQIEVADDWRIVATMNVFDKALLYEMSFALMRRFAFVEVPAPRPDNVRMLINATVGAGSAAAELSGEMHDRVAPLKELGPAIYLDLARYLRHRFSGDPSVDRQQLAFEGFYSYLLPQFEGIEPDAAARLERAVRPLVGRSRRERLHATLEAVLGVRLPAMR